ncbi:MAG: CPBP family intramembrane glutamic endopeptidase [candidate division WOR-3 bacterium]
MKKWIEYLIIVVVGAVGAGLFFGFYEKVLPSAAVDLKLSKADVIAKARDFWTARGVNLSGYQEATVFSADNEASVYLQKTIGVDSANALGKGTVPIWFWRVRFFKPLTKEEFIARIEPDGRLSAFQHIISEDAPGDYLTEAEALELATNYLRDNFGMDPAEWEMVKSSSEDRKARRDYYFTFKKPSAVWGESDLRVDVVLAGSEVASVIKYLKVPEEFTRSYQSQRSFGSLLGTIATLLAVLMVFAGVIMFFVSLRKRGNDIKLATLVGVALGLSILISNATLIPTYLARYDTATQLSSYLVQIFMGMALSVLVLGFFVGVAAGWAGDAINKKETLWGLVPLSRGRLSRRMAGWALLSYPLAFFFMGLQVIIYFFGVKFMGVWAPAESEYTMVFASSIPALFALGTSLSAGLNEEVLFRFFGFALFKKAVRNTFLAFLIPTVIWAFLHSGYEIFPVYFRGIELTIGGLLFAFVFWRYGLFTAIMTHWIVDTLYFTIPLMKSSSMGFVISGAVAAGFGLIIALVALFGKPEKDIAVSEKTISVVSAALDYFRDHPEALHEFLIKAGLSDALPAERLRYLVKELMGLRLKEKKDQYFVKGLAAGDAELLSGATGLFAEETKKGWVFRKQA